MKINDEYTLNRFEKLFSGWSDKAILVWQFAWITLLFGFGSWLFMAGTEQRAQEYLTMSSPVRVEISKGHVIHATLIEVIQYAIDEEWDRQIADEDRKN